MMNNRLGLSILCAMVSASLQAQQINYSFNGSNGADGLNGTGISTSASSGQATIAAEGIGDIFANLNLGSNLSGVRRFWHISKRQAADGHALQFYFYDGTSFQWSKFTLSTNGNVGVGTSIPRGKFDVDGPGDIYLNDDPINGAGQNIFLPGHIYLSPHVGGSNVSYIQARRLDNSGTTSLRFRTYNNGSMSEAMHIEGNGNVGIGTTTPYSPMHVKGTGLGAHLTIETNANGQGDLQWFQGGNAAVNQRAAFQVSNTSGDFEAWVYGTSDWQRWLSVVRNSGNVGIGTTNPGTYKLAVEGKIGAREVNVTASAWADYVLKDGYQLRPLSEVKKFISENRHLPEVPSEKEVLANGQNLGEMNAILLKKIEELTLYVIELKEENVKLHALEKRVDELTKLLEK